jgi:large subunit ribosomal protein L9
MTAKSKRRPQLPWGPHGGLQVVLLEDLPHLGQQGDVVEVKPGYARNYLLPRGLAVLSTPENRRRFERYRQRLQQAREARIADLQVLAEQIQRLGHLNIEANANEEGHLYGSVGPAEIARALKNHNLPVEPEMVRLEGQIKQCGLYEVELHLGFHITTKVQVLVVPTLPEKT